MKWLLSALLFGALVYLFGLIFGGDLDAYIHCRDAEKYAEREKSEEVKRFRAV